MVFKVLKSEPKIHSGFIKIDLIVVSLANLINIVMAFLFVARLSSLPQVQYVLGIITMIMGFALGYVAFLNKKNKRDKWMTYLLIPIFIFFVVELTLDYFLEFNFRSTSIVIPYIVLYYVGLWGLIGYSFLFDKKWGFITLVTYFANMIMSILPYI